MRQLACHDGDLARIPDGTYAADLTKAYAMETGWLDSCLVEEGRGVSVLVIEGESWTQLSSCGDGAPEVGAIGTFEYDGDRVVIREPGISGQATFSWSVAGDALTLKLVENDEAYAPRSVLRLLFEHEFTMTAS